MIDPKEKEVLEKAMRINWLIWGAMFASIGVYVLVAHLTAGTVRISPGIGDVFGLLRTILLIIGIGELLLIPVIKRLAMKSASATKGGGIGAGLLAMQSHPAVAKYTTALVVSSAIAESVAIYGLVLFFLSGDFGTLYLFTALGAAGMLVNRPKGEELDSLAGTIKKTEA